MQPLDSFLQYLIPRVIGCPVPLAHQAIVRAARTFCEETNVVTRMIEPLALAPGESTYDIDLDSDTDAIRVLGAWLGNSPLRVPTARDAAHPIMSFPDLGVGVGAQQGVPSVLTVLSPNTVTVYPAPGDDAYPRLTVRVATRPKVSARSLDDNLFNRWLDGVVSGAEATLTSIPGQAFTDPGQSVSADVRFWRAVNRARIEAQRGDVGSSLRVRNNPLV